MKTFILAMLIMTATAFSCEWKDANIEPVQQWGYALMYEASTDKVAYGIPSEFSLLFWMEYGRDPMITYWMPTPKTPHLR